MLESSGENQVGTGNAGELGQINDEDRAISFEGGQQD